MTNQVNKKQYTLNEIKQMFPGFGLPPAKITAPNDELLAGINAVHQATNFLIGYQVPYVTPVLQFVNFISNTLRVGVAYNSIPNTAPIERTLGNPLVQHLSKHIFNCPTALAISSGAQLIGSARGTATKITNYMKSPVQDKTQSPIKGALIHAFNLGCQFINTMSDIRNPLI